MKTAPTVLAVGIAIAATLPLGCGGRGVAPDAAESAPSASVQSVSDGDLAATVSLSATTLEVGQPLVIELKAEAPPPFSIELPPDAALAPFEVAGPGTTTRGVDPTTGAATMRRRIVAAAWEGGEPTVPALTFTFRPEQGDARTLVVPATPVTVTSLVEEPFDPAAFADLRPLPAGARPRAWWPWAAAGVAVVAAAGLWLVRRRRRAPAPPPDAEAWALAQLAALRAEALPGRGEVDPYFTRLVDVVRGYLERRLGFAAGTRSSEEFLRVAAADPRFHAAPRTSLEGLLRFADIVKFARGAATPVECAMAMDRVTELVAALRPSGVTAGRKEQAAT